MAGGASRRHGGVGVGVELRGAGSAGRGLRGPRFPSGWRQSGCGPRRRRGLPCPALPCPAIPRGADVSGRSRGAPDGGAKAAAEVPRSAQPSPAPSLGDTAGESGIPLLTGLLGAHGLLLENIVAKALAKAGF